MKSEHNIAINVQELGIILTALQVLDVAEEWQIARYYGSAPSLYNRLKEIYDGMDQSTIGEQNDPICEPSF